jgi:hypothetical protein
MAQEYTGIYKLALDGGVVSPASEEIGSLD